MSTTSVVPERRRTPRVAIAAGTWLAMPATWRVQLLDISLGGAALSSPYALDPGRTASVRATLGGQAFHARMRVCWSRDVAGALPGTPQFTIGAVFLPLEEDSRRALHGFLKLSS